MALVDAIWNRPKSRQAGTTSSRTSGPSGRRKSSRTSSNALSPCATPCPDSPCPSLTRSPSRQSACHRVIPTDYTMPNSKRVSLALRLDAGRVSLAVQFQYEPDPKRTDATGTSACKLELTSVSTSSKIKLSGDDVRRVRDRSVEERIGEPGRTPSHPRLRAGISTTRDPLVGIALGAAKLVRFRS